MMGQISHRVAAPKVSSFRSLIAPIFAISRISGWAAHLIEQLDDNRLIRPRAEYIGPVYPSPYIPIEERG
jgi:citrate synthase